MSKNLIVKQSRILRKVEARKGRRNEIKALIKGHRKDADYGKVFEMQQLLTSAVGRHGSPVRYRRVCSVTGRSRGNYRFFRLSRTEILRAWRRGHLFGLRKSSW